MTSRHTILVVEDDPEIQQSLCDVLESEGYGVVAASNGREGLDRLREIEEPCVILLDLMMPVMSGSDFLAILRSTNIISSIPVVVVSAWPNEAAQLAEQTQGFVKKPVTLEVLLDAVSQFCTNANEDCQPDPRSNRIALE